MAKLYSLNKFLRKYQEKVENHPEKEAIIKFCKVLADQMASDKRFNGIGQHNELYALAHLLHPQYRGVLLRGHHLYDDFIAKIISEHPTTVDYYRKQRDSQQETQMLDDDSDDLDNLDAIMKEQNRANPNTSQDAPDLELELKVIVIAFSRKTHFFPEKLTFFPDRFTFFPIDSIFSEKLTFFR